MTLGALRALSEAFRRRIKMQTVRPVLETVPLLFWSLLPSGQIRMRKVDGWETLDHAMVPATLDEAA